MFSKLKERISRLKEKKFEKEDKKAILVAFLSIFLILLSYYLTKNIAYPITILVILVILFLINAFYKPSKKKEDYEDTYSFYMKVYSSLLYKSSMKESLLLSLDLIGKEEVNYKYRAYLESEEYKSKLPPHINEDEKEDDLALLIYQGLNRSYLSISFLETFLSKVNKLERKKKDAFKVVINASLFILVIYVAFIMYNIIAYI